MTLLYADGFDLQDLLLRWIGNTNFAGTYTLQSGQPGRFSGTSMRIVTNSSGNEAYQNIFRAIPASNTVFVGFAAKILNSLGNVSGTNGILPIISFATDSGLSQQIYITVDNLGHVMAYRGQPWVGNTNNAPGTQLGISVPASIPVDATSWAYVEVAVVVHPSLGSIIVRVNGNAVLSLSGINTKNGGSSNSIDGVFLGQAAYGFSGAGSASTAYDDLYICNDAGTVNNTFLGDLRVQTLLPTGAGSSTQLTPTGSANNFANVNDVPDLATTYNSSPTSGQRDTYAMADLAAGAGSVLAVQQVTHALKSDAGAASLKAAQKSGATVSYGATRSLSTSNTAYVDVFELNPATSAAYTVAEVNSLEAGAEVV